MLPSNEKLLGKELFVRVTARAFRKLLSVYVFSYFPFGLRAGYGIWLYQFLIIAYLFTLSELSNCKYCFNIYFLIYIMDWFPCLAHLSRMLTRWTFCIESLLSFVDASKLESTWGQLTSLDHILYHYWDGWKAAILVVPQDDHNHITVIFFPGFQLDSGKKGRLLKPPPPPKYFYTDRSKAVLLLWFLTVICSCFRIYTLVQLLC